MRALTDARLTDALQELSNLGAAAGVSMLARLVSTPVMVDTPRLTLGDSTWLMGELGGPGAAVVAAELSVSGSLHARLWWALPELDACRLAARLLKVPSIEPALPRPAVDALTEAANLVASAYCATWSTFLGLQLAPSPPDLVEGDAAALAGSSSERWLVLQQRFFSVESPSFSGHLMVTLEQPALDVLTPKLQRLGSFQPPSPKASPPPRW